MSKHTPWSEPGSPDLLWHVKPGALEEAKKASARRVQKMVDHAIKMATKRHRGETEAEVGDEEAV